MSSFLPRRAAILGFAALAILCAGSASAQSPFSFEVDNLTFSGGDAAFPVTDDLTFTNLQINEVFADSTTATVSLTDLDTGIISEFSPFEFDGVHGSLQSATLTGSLIISGFLPSSTLDLALQPTLDPASQYTQTVKTSFSTVLNKPQSGVGVGLFSLNYNGTPLFAPTVITVAAVPEASTATSMGLMLALGLGGLIVLRRRTSSAK